MRIAVISDIHGNLEAFNEVLHDQIAAGVDAIVDLGDNIGYGPEPEAVVSLVRDRQIPVVMGNHEEVLLRPERSLHMNPTARESMDITQDLLSEETQAFCRSLPRSLTLYDALFVHACPPDSVTTYLVNPRPDRLARVFSSFSEPLCFFGHTHLLALHRETAGVVHSEKLAAGTLPLKPDTRYLVNVGSVGQPRDGNNKAKYVVWDSTDATIEVRYVSYDIKVTTDKILKLGFPEFNAYRLR